jgi:hypothetical protein
MLARDADVTTTGRTADSFPPERTAIANVSIAAWAHDSSFIQAGGTEPRFTDSTIISNFFLCVAPTGSAFGRIFTRHNLKIFKNIFFSVFSQKLKN